MNPKRYSNQTFPVYAFLPGRSPHPEKEGGHMYQKELNIETYNPADPLACDTFLYALDLLNHGYFWESHVYLEELWNQLHRTGEDAELFKVLIKLGAAGVKHKLGQSKPACGHLDRALEILEEKIPSPVVAGLNIEALKNKIITWKEDKLESPLFVEVDL